MRKGILRSALLGAGALGAISIAGAGVAQANLVKIGFAQSNNGATPVSITDASSYAGGNTYSHTDGYVSFSGQVDNVKFTADTATGIPNLGPGLLLNGSVGSLTFSNISTNNTFWVYMTETGLTQPLGTYNIASTLTANSLSSSIDKVIESTYVDNSNTAWGMASPLSTRTFKATGAVGGQGSGAGGGLVATTPNLTGTYSLTEVFMFEASAQGASGSGQIHMKNVPEPGSLALLGTGLLGLGLIVRRRRRKA